jgi:hypothetical protein
MTGEWTVPLGEDFLLEKAQVQATAVLPPGVFDVEYRIEHTAREMALHLRATVMRHRLKRQTFTDSKTVEFTVPASWWDAFKQEHAQRWWARWWVRRHPARTTVLSERVTFGVTVDPEVVFPEQTVVGERSFAGRDTWGTVVPHQMTTAEFWGSV